MTHVDPLAMALADVDGNADPDREDFIQAEYATFASRAREYLSARPWTPPRINPDGSKTIRVKRCCNGCGRRVRRRDGRSHEGADAPGRACRVRLPARLWDVTPIRPEMRARYPDDWRDIAHAVKERAGWRCECEGECGRGTHDGRCPSRHGEPAYGTGSIVVLTTAHLDHIPEHCDPTNLRAMCQGCHLHYDRDHHAQTRSQTRRREAEAAGQGTLL